MFRPFGSVLVELERIPDTSEPSNISSRNTEKDCKSKLQVSIHCKHGSARFTAVPLHFFHVQL